MDLAIILPVYGQGSLLCESINSALEQETRFDYRIILVDDCCPQQETVDNCLLYARRYPDRILYWRSPENRGLAAMRNEGIRLALENWPDLFAVTSFDGDDRLHPKFVARGVSALRSAQQEQTDGFRYGWVFEDPDHFGIDGVMLRTHGYSQLFSMAGCSNTPTSPMLADIFRTGLRFRETMKEGSEDWQFWLAALKKGFRGKYVPKIGFRYRRKSGSMAFFAFRQANRNRTEIRLSHPELYHPDFYLAAEAAEAPRYALGTFEDGPDDTSGTMVARTPACLVQMLEQYDRIPTSPIPQYVVFLSAGTRDELARAGLLDWLLWRLEMLCGSKHGARARLFAPEDPEIAVSVRADRAAASKADHAEAICVPTALLLNFAKGESNARSAIRQIDLRQNNIWLHGVPRTNVVPQFNLYCDLLRHLYKPHKTKFSRHDTTKWKPFGLERTDLAEHFFGASPILADPEASREILLVAQEDDLERAHVDDLVSSLCSQAAQLGKNCSLLVLGSKVGRQHSGRFRRILLARQVRRGDRLVVEAGEKAFLGLLLPFGTVVSIGCASIAADLNQLRRYGRSVFAVLPDRSSGATQLHGELMHCFKVFSGVYCANDDEIPFAEAHGVAAEQMIGSARELFFRAGGKEAIPE